MPIFLKSGSLNLLEPSGPVQANNGIVFLLLFTNLTFIRVELIVNSRPVMPVILRKKSLKRGQNLSTKPSVFCFNACDPWRAQGFVGGDV